MGKLNNWLDFEKKVLLFLRNTFGFEEKIIYTHEGGTSSHSLDIIVSGKNGKKEKKINLEVKCAPAQCGQFVMERVAGQFRFKTNSKRTEVSTLQKEFIAFINFNYNKVEVTQAAIEVNYPQKKICDLVKEHYEKKGVQFFVTGSQNNPDFIIVPLKEIDKVFSFKANLRNKKSGTRAMPKKIFKQVEDLLSAKCDSLGVKKISLEFIGRKLIISTNCARKLKSSELYFGPGDCFYISQLENLSTFEIKVTSSTNNVNVVYSLEIFNNKQDDKWSDLFSNKLQELLS